MRSLLLLLFLSFTGPVFGQSQACEIGELQQHSFPSGASWNVCVTLDDDHALELTEAYYRAPGDQSRKVLREIHLAQLLVHYHDEEQPLAFITSKGLGGDALLPLDNLSCNGEVRSLAAMPALCSQVQSVGLLAKFSLRRGLIAEKWQLFTVTEQDGLTFKLAYALTEDGRIIPSVEVSGRTGKSTADSRYGVAVTGSGTTPESAFNTRATLMYSWRMAFALNDNQLDDKVEEINFPISPAGDNRRPQQTTELATETLRQIDRESFRGWRIVDQNGSGYYLDPQNSGFAYQDPHNNWARFDFALTRYAECERHSRITSEARSGQSNCGYSLDDYVNGESMQDTTPVLWYSLTQHYRPRAEDYPAISSLRSEFELLPFDWTPTSPFEVHNQ